jgi:heat shock protein beta
MSTKRVSLLILIFLITFQIALLEETPQKTEEQVIDGFNSQQREELDKVAEKFNFNADISRLMDIIINSLYTHKEVFIRELISNASDACEKVRFFAIQNPEFLGDKKELEIRIEFDEDAKTFTITDTGVGMTKNELVKNLGTIAKTGTTAFIEAISKGNSLNLIGQFGVGFYSTYLVSNKVVVTSKNNEDEQTVWVSTAGSYFTVTKDPRGNTLGRGSRITLYLKEDSYDFVSQDIIKKNIKKYSEFINFPIYLRVNKTVTREEEYEEPAETSAASEKNATDSNATEGLEVSDEEKKPEVVKKKRTITEHKFEWELINENKPLWLKKKDEIAKEEYTKFYKALTKETEDPIAWDHSAMEGEVNFKYLYYIPAKKPYDLFENYYGKNAALKLYVRRVLVNEQFEELMPRYMNFIKGIVDSDDLPLNVSREQLQQDKLIKVMSRKLTRNIIGMMTKLANDQLNDEDDEEEEEEEETPEGEKKEEKKEEEKKDEKKVNEKYNKFWEAFGKNIKLGVIEDTQNKSKLAKLLRFFSTKSPTELISLDDYIAGKKDGQENIYFIAGDDRELLKKSPLIQSLVSKGFEVLLLDDPIDEFCMQNLAEYEKLKVLNVSKGNLKFGDETDLDRKKFRKLRDAFKPLIDWWKNLLGDKVEKVDLSKRLTDTPCIVVSSEYGHTANMEKITKAQAFNSPDKNQSFMMGKKTFEINPSHPSIKELLKRIKESELADEETKDSANLLFEAALLNSGKFFY